MSMANGDLVVVGLISGTSADGIDGVVAKLPVNPSLVDVQGLTHHHVPLTGARRRPSSRCSTRRGQQQTFFAS